jgi:phage-related tail fiber protein
MAKYPGVTLTNAGINMMAESQGDGQLTFTSIKLGDGSLADGEDIKALTAVKNPMLTANINTIDTSTAGQVSLTAIISNAAVTTGFFAREIGVYAKIGTDGKEQLYAYSNAGNYADYMTDNKTPVDENKIKITLVVGAAANVTAIIDASLVYATQQAAQEIITAHDNNLSAHGALMTAHNADSHAHTDIRAAIKNIDLSAYATTAFVQNMCGNLRGAVGYNASLTLSSADLGKLIELSTTGMTVTLPTNGIAAGSTVHFLNTSGGNVTIAATRIWASAVGIVTSRTLACTCAATYVYDGASWVEISVNDRGKESMGAYGYKLLDKGSGLTLQWGATSAIAAQSTVYTAFRVAFTEVYTVVATPYGGMHTDNDNGTVVVTGMPSSGFYLCNNGDNALDYARFQAIGFVG